MRVHGVRAVLQRAARVRARAAPHVPSRVSQQMKMQRNTMRRLERLKDALASCTVAQDGSDDVARNS